MEDLQNDIPFHCRVDAEAAADLAILLAQPSESPLLLAREDPVSLAEEPEDNMDKHLQKVGNMIIF
jgi:hypothetical protein